jgi:hypothetical protein
VAKIKGRGSNPNSHGNNKGKKAIAKEVTMLPEQWAKAEKAGKGNFSKGLRKAIEAIGDIEKMFVLQEGDVWLSTDSMISCGVFSDRKKAINAIKLFMDRKYPGVCVEIESEYPSGFDTGTQWISNKHEVGIVIKEVNLDEFCEF